MKLKKIFIFLFISTGLFGQDYSVRKAIIGLSFMPNTSYRNLNFQKSNEIFSTVRNAEEIPKFSYLLGININHRINKKLAIQSGILYSNQGYQTKFQSLYWAVSNNDYPNKSKTIFNFSQVEIPLNLNYTLIRSNHYCFYAIIGSSPTVFISRKVDIISKSANGETVSQSNTKYVGNSRYNLSVNIGVGLSYKISNRFSIHAEPKFQHSINSIIVDLNAKEYLYNVGVDFKCYYSFLKKKVN